MPPDEPFREFQQSDVGKRIAEIATEPLPGSSAVTCNHGFWLHDCVFCLKRPSECDYGSCEERAATRLEHRVDGCLVEARAMCERHGQDPTLKLAHDIAALMGGHVEDTGDFWEIAA